MRTDKNSWNLVRLNKYKGDLKLLLIDLELLFAAFGGFYRDGFGNDTLLQMINPLAGINTWYTNGRYLGYFLSYALYRVGFIATDHYKLCFLFFIFSLAVSTLLVQKTLEPHVRPYLTTTLHKAGFCAATGLIYCNVLFTEHFMFTECFLVYPFAYLSAALAVYFIAVRNRKFTGLFWLVIASLFYQVALVQAAMILAAWLVLRDRAEFSVRLVWKEILSAFAVIGIIVLNYMSMKVLAALHITYWAAKDINTGNNLAEKTAFLVPQFIQFLESSLQLLPPLWMPLLYTAVCIAVLTGALIRNRMKKEVVSFILLILLMTGLVFLIPFIQSTYGFNPRIVFIFYTEQSLLFVAAFIFSDRRRRSLLCGISCAWIMVQIVFGNVIMANHYLSNQLDLTYTQMVYNKVVNYEQETGMTVDKFCAINDINSPSSYDEVEYKRDQINERGLSIEPYCLYLVVSGRKESNVQKVEMDPAVYSTYFKDKNWDYFDIDQQVIIQGDILYWCVF